MRKTLFFRRLSFFSIKDCTIFAPMNRLLSLIAALALSTMQAAASDYIDRFFAYMPQRVLPILDKTSRLDLIDLYNNAMKAKAENVYGGMSEMVHKSDYYLSLKLSDASTWQMRIIPIAHDTLIVCAHSLNANGTSTTLHFYKEDWHSVKRDMVPPSQSQFLLPNTTTLSSSRMQLLRGIAQSLPIKATLDEKLPVITFELSLEALPSDERDDLKLITQSLRYDLLTGKQL